MRNHGFVCLAATVFFAASANAVDITGVDGNGYLVAVSTPATVADQSGNSQRLNTGVYDINNPLAAIDLSERTGNLKNLSMGEGTTLNIHANAATALKVNEFIIASGELNVHGGNSSHVLSSSGRAYGLDTSSDFKQNGGTVNAFATTGDVYGSGISVYGNYIQNGGVLTTAGGTRSSGGGLQVIKDFIQNAGTAYVKAGTGEWTNGLSVTENATFNDKLFIQRGGAGSDGRALNVGAASGEFLTFGANSELTYDLAGAGALPYIRAKDVKIESGAKINFINTAGVGAGVSEYTFIDSLNGIEGEFAFTESATLEMTIEKWGYYSQEYRVYFNRTGTAGDVVATAPGVG